uniref:Uncharacterized protein n=1 Tax=Acrobeloides nanus TaxID=290746 RepID=A0A914CVE6_9BILA
MQCQNVRNSQFQELQEPINSPYQPTNSPNQSIISSYQPINSPYQLINLPNQQINSSYELINSPNQSINSSNENNLPDYFDLTTDEEMDEYTIPSIKSIYQDLMNECESNTILRPIFENFQ